MNWGPDPDDLDLHVLQFTKTGYVCKTYYANKNGCVGLSLDVDNTIGGNAGAETITWNQDLSDYDFLIYVQDWSRWSTHPFKDSQAVLSVYGNSSTLIQRSVPRVDPNGNSRYWLIGCFNGAVGLDSFELLNLLTNTVPNPNICPSTGPVGLGLRTGLQRHWEIEPDPISKELEPLV